MKLAYIIPTIGRYEELKSLLVNLENQTVKPDLVVVVDTGSRYSREKIKVGSIPLKYVYTGSHSLTEGRNSGVKNVPDDFNLLGFLDDDLLLYNDATEIMVAFWRSASNDVGGAAFNIMHDRKPRRWWLLKNIFIMGDSHPGNVLRSGYQTFLDRVVSDTYSKWLPGGTTVWRREVFSKFKFDEGFNGHAHNEDLDFSYRVGKEYKLIVLGKAMLAHTPHLISGGVENFKFGISEIVNRFLFVKKHKEFSVVLFFWASVGKLLENIIFGVINLNSCYFKRALGNIAGVKIAMLNNLKESAKK